ncbi:terpene synthase family protein [Streptomyces sp. GS7]|uniref:terpene synthase family protein n=1 Tax=Streptomyces sp. GS7 TaxID=2692234 RepID=UPI00131995AA|nr:hypothetical protein [Streptomyces sp. GS7]QHC24519.1 hypothetical protein GR130_27245 [Streptomyces sp. GS7]
MPRSYELPALEMPLPEYGVAAAVDAAETDMWNWLESHRLLDDAVRRERLVRTGPHYTTALYYPHAGADRLTVVNRYMALAFLVDDFDEEISAQDDASVSEYCEDLVAVACGTRPPSNGAGRAMADVIGTLSQGRSLAWCEAVMHSVAQWLRTYPVQVRLARAGKSMPLHQYVAHRRHGVGEIPFLHMHEYVQDVDLPARVRNLPALVYARNRASEWIGLLNDVFSLEKEEAVSYPHNAVLLVRQQRGLGTQDAVDVVNGVLSGLLAQFDAACRTIPGQVRAVVNDDSPVVDDVMRIVEGYRHVVRGNFDYHYASARFTTRYELAQ